MEWGTEIGTGIISASPPPGGPAQGALPVPDSGLRARGTAEFLASAVTGLGTRGASAKLITDGLYAALSYFDATPIHGISADLRHGQHGQLLGVSCSGVEICPMGSGVHLIRRYGPRP